MFDISPLCQANLALWHAIMGLITAVCGLEGTQAAPAALTGPDRLIRSVGTQKTSRQTPHISLRRSQQFASARSIVLSICTLTRFFSSLLLSLDTLSLFS